MRVSKYCWLENLSLGNPNLTVALKVWAFIGGKIEGSTEQICGKVYHIDYIVQSSPIDQEYISIHFGFFLHYNNTLKLTKSQSFTRHDKS